MHKAILDAWLAASAWFVGRYVVMPNHLHLFCAPNGIEAPSLERLMRYWKSLATRALANTAVKSGNAIIGSPAAFRESYEEKWEYVRNIRCGTVTSLSRGLALPGVLNELRW